MPAAVEDEQSWGVAAWQLEHVHCEIKGDASVVLDGNISNAVGRFVESRLDSQNILVTVQFKNDATYRAHLETGRLSIKYHMLRWRTMGPRTVNVFAIVLLEIGLCSPAFVRKTPRKKVASLKDTPVIQIRPVNYAAGNGAVNSDAREVVLEFIDNGLYVPDYGENIIAQPVARLASLVNKPVYPADKNGEAVNGAVEIGKIVAAWWDTEKVDDAEYELKNNGAKRFLAFGKARIRFNVGPAGDRELKAFVDKEERGAVVSFQVNRYGRELIGQEYANQILDWELLSIGIEGATVLTEAEQRALLTPPAPEPVKQPGLLKRLFA